MCSHLTLPTAGGFLRVWANKRTFGVEGATVAGLLASEDLLDPGDNFVGRRVGGLIEVDDLATPN